MKIIKVMSHKLNEAQVAELINHEITNLADIQPELAKKLDQTTDDWDALSDLAQELINVCGSFDAAILPVGSPAFGFLLAQKWPKEVKPLFAHSVRRVEEKEVEEIVEIEPGKFEKKLVIKKTNIFDHKRFF